MSFLGSETFSTPEFIAEYTNHTHTPSRWLSHSIHSHLFTFSSTQRCLWNNHSWCNAGQVRKKKEGGLPFQLQPAASLVLPQLLLSLLCFYPRVPNTSLRLFPSDPHSSQTSCTHDPLALDHCVLIAALAGYIGQTPTCEVGWGAIIVY